MGSALKFLRGASHAETRFIQQMDSCHLVLLGSMAPWLFLVFQGPFGNSSDQYIRITNQKIVLSKVIVELSQRKPDYELEILC